MNIITNIERWGNSHRPGFLDIFRVLLGTFITYKGLYFVVHLDELQMTTEGINVYFAGMTLAHYVVFAHILGGPMIFFGIFTRIVSVVQLPILFGAVFMVNYPKGFLSIGHHMELWVSIVVLTGLLIFIVFGAGKFSIDARRRRDLETAH